jgi:DNA-binding HxlR family transcriptional regulator
MRWNDLGEEHCSLARAVSVIGDRWTMLILRDCFLRVRRFEDFQERLGITRPILASRLKKLVDEFVLTKVAYQQRPTLYEYRLTPKGLDLYPVVMALVHWGDVHMAGKKGHRCCTRTMPAARISTRSWCARNAASRSIRPRCTCIPVPMPPARGICRRGWSRRAPARRAADGGYGRG